jgi:hypothetical protein
MNVSVFFFLVDLTRQRQRQENLDARLGVVTDQPSNKSFSRREENEYSRALEELAKRLETEFKRFVAVTLVRPGMVHAPSGPVDMYWHFFILHTRQYRQFCTDIWGNERA